MPAHRADLQQLIYAMQGRLARHARIAEWLLLLGADGIPREIDLAIEWPAGAHPVRIAIEYHDGARPASGAWVMELRAKYRALPIAQLVVVARRGFTEAARATAAAYGIRTLTLVEARNADWLQLCERVVRSLRTRASDDP